MAYQPVPAANLSTASTLAHLQGILHKRKALDRLQTTFLFGMPCMNDVLDLQSGRTAQWFRYDNFGANTTPSPEGQVKTSLSTQSRTVQCMVSEYSDYVTVSSLLKETAPDAIMQSNAELLGYRAGLSVDNITRAVLDAEQASTDLALLAGTFKAQDVRNARAQLRGRDVRPLTDGLYLGLSHPYVTFDLVNDPAANGLADIYKYTKPADASLVRYDENGQVCVVGGCKILETTNVTLIAGSPNKWRNYFFGLNGVGKLDLSGRGPSKVTDPTKQRFQINVIPGERSIADPEGTIGGAVSYRFVFGVVVLEGPAGIAGQYRFRTIDAPSSIVA